MEDLILFHVGARIRQYRRSRGLTAEQLAQRIHKSKATVSKYESGRIAVDVATLYNIAEVLGVSTAQLFDFVPPGSRPQTGQGSPFGEYDRLFLYHMSGGEIYPSALRLTPDSGGISATLLYKLHGQSDADPCDCIYHGRMYYHDILVAFVMQNYHNPVENILMNFNVPLKRSRALTGMICGLGGNTMAPTAYKVALSEQPLADDALRGLLTISPETFREMKRKNVLFIPLD